METLSIVNLLILSNLIYRLNRILTKIPENYFIDIDKLILKFILKSTYKNKPKNIKKMVTGTYKSIITLNVNGLNTPTKRHRLAEWIQKQDPYICYLQETHFRPRDTYRLKVRGWKKMFHANGNKRKLA